MTRLILARHAQSTANVERWISGWTDVQLTYEGRKQAKELGERLKDVNFGGIIASDLSRARETAEIAGRFIKKPVELDQGFRERNYGKFTGLSYREPQAVLEGEIARMRTNLTYIPSGGESLLQHQERVVNAIKTACSKWKDNNVLIVSHRGTIRVFLMWLYGKEFGLYAKIPDPPGYVEVLWDEKTNRSDILHTMIT